MLQHFQTEPDLLLTSIEKIRLPLQSRDELPPILAGLQWLWMHPTLRTDILALLDDGLLQQINARIAVPDRERKMSIVVPLTTEQRGGECEVAFPKPAWLRQESVVNVLGIAGVDNSKIIRRLAPFPQESLAQVYAVLRRAMGIA